MEITPWTIYLWQMADRLISIAEPLAFCGLFFGFIGLALCVVFGPEIKNNEMGRVKIIPAILLLIGIPSVLISVFFPSSKTVAMMAVIPAIANSNVIQQDVPDLYNAAVEALKDQLKKKD